MVSWWMLYLAKGPRPDFKNCPRDNSNTCCILPPPPRLFDSDSNDGPSPGHSNLGQLEDTPAQISYLWFPGGFNIWPRAPRPEFNNGPGVPRIVAVFWPPSIYLSPI